MARKSNEVTYNVIKSYGVLSESKYERTNWQTKEKELIHETKELRKVSWNGGTPKLEVRTWYNTNGVETCGKGTTFTQEELDNFRFILEDLDNEVLAEDDSKAV